MTLLVIGGTGVLSSAVVVEALKQGINVTMINRGNRERYILPGVNLIKSDKNDKVTIAQGLNVKRFDAIIDFLCFTPRDVEESFKFYSSYTRQYIFISSCAVYDKTVAGPKNEDSPKVLKIWPYSVNKWASEQCLYRLAEKSDINYTVIRPCVTYGDTRIPYGISPRHGYDWTLVARILHGKPIIRWNGGTTRCNMLRVEDFAIGLIGLIGNPKAYNDVFNICGDETPSFAEVIEALSRVVGKEAVFVDITSEFYAHELPERAGEILGGRSIDGINKNDKIKAIVPNFKQNIFLREGVSMTYQAYISQNYQLGIDWKFEGDCDRIIRKWCKIRGIDSRCYNLKFVDYLGNANRADRMSYYFALNRNRLYIRLLKYGARIIRRLRQLLNN